MTEGVHLGSMIGFADEWVVLGNAALVSDTQDLSALRVRVLRILRILWIGAGRRDVEHAVATERDPGRAGAIEHEDVLHFGQRLAIEAAARNRNCLALLGERLGVRHITKLD